MNEDGFEPVDDDMKNYFLERLDVLREMNEKGEELPLDKAERIANLKNLAGREKSRSKRTALQATKEYSFFKERA